MAGYLEVAARSYQGYARYVWHEVTHPHARNFVYWLIGLSLAVYALELAFSWRRDQAKIRRDFWLDGFYMFFNLFLFSLIVFNAAGDVVVAAGEELLGRFGLRNLVAIQIRSWPAWAQLLTLFVLRDFIHWNIHRLLHRVPRLWEFHKVHHSVLEMGFAAHLRFHWMESVVYKSLQYIPLALIGFGLDDFFLAHVVALAIGHLNHANLRLPIGPLRYVFNTPQMHIWHHARVVPGGHRYGVNYGLSLSLWDYLFGTACIPSDGRNVELGFDDVERFPATFVGQITHGFGRLPAPP